MADQKKNEWLHPDYPPLRYNDAVGYAAIEGQLLSYPKVVRSMTDPGIINQTLGLLSFKLFEKPCVLSTGKLVYGFVKLRGNYANKEDCEANASKIIRDVDSKFQIHIAPVGTWVPITEEDAFVKEKLDVRMKDEELHLRDKAMKEKEEKEKKMMREIKEREEELKSGDIYDHPESVEFYTMKRMTELKLMEARDNYIKNVDSIKDKLSLVQRELYKLTIVNPQYTDMWIDVNNAERKKAGIPDYAPSEEYILEHDRALEKLKTESIDLDSIKLPENYLPKKQNNTESEQKREISDGSVNMVMKQGCCGNTLAKMALDQTGTVVDAILHVKKSIETIMKECECQKLVAVGSLEMSNGDIEKAIEFVKQNQ